MFKLIVILLSCVALTACEFVGETLSVIDESCYFQLDVDTDYYRQRGLGTGPYGVVSNVMFDEYSEGKRIVPPIGENGKSVFADRCDLIGSESFVALAFEGTGFEYKLTKITQSQYAAFAENQGEKAHSAYECDVGLWRENCSP